MECVDPDVTSTKIDIWSDIACPWCFIGKRRLEKALESYSGEVEIEYHSFELAPDTPVDYEGSQVDFLVKHKNMPPEQVAQMLEQVTATAASEGLTFDYEALQHTKTLKAHEALHHAKAHGRQAQLKERLLAAHFEEGRHLGQIEEIVALATEVGLDAEVLTQELEADTHADAVAADINQAIEYGISGVPFFVFDGRLGVAGAQPAETFADVLARIDRERVS